MAVTPSKGLEIEDPEIFEFEIRYPRTAVVDWYLDHLDSGTRWSWFSWTSPERRSQLIETRKGSPNLCALQALVTCEIPGGLGFKFGLVKVAGESYSLEELAQMSSKPKEALDFVKSDNFRKEWSNWEQLLKEDRTKMFDRNFDESLRRLGIEV